MKSFIFFLILCLIFPFAFLAAAQAEECTFDPSGLKPIMHPSQELEASHTVSLSKDKRTLTESVTLTNGMKITYTSGGCDHYGFSYFFDDVPMELFIGRESFDLAMNILSYVPGLKDTDGRKFFDILRQAAADETVLDDSGGFECGDAYCRIWKDKNHIELHYDSSL